MHINTWLILIRLSFWSEIMVWGTFQKRLRALKFATWYKSNIFQCMHKIFCVEFQRYPMEEFGPKISHPHIEIYVFYSHVKIHEFLNLRSFWNAPMVSFQCVNSYKPMWNEPSSVQIIACRLLSAKPSSEPMLVYCQSQPLEQTSVKFSSESKDFHSKKCI